MDTKPILTMYKFNKIALEHNLNSISDEECNKIPSENVNSLNWVTGHIVLTRDEILELLGKNKLCSGEFKEKYKRGSTTSAVNDPVPMKEILDMLNASQELITYALEYPEAEALMNEDTLNSLGFYGFHESYHVGQTGVIRKLLGKEGAIK